MGKISRQKKNKRNEDIFLIFPRKTGFNSSCKLFPLEDLHEMSNPVFWEEQKPFQNVSAENFTWVLSVKYTDDKISY